MKVLGIHSSPLPQGNTAHFLGIALEQAAQAPDVTTESVALSGLSIGDCRHCNWCATHQTPERLCALEDDATSILARIRDCDVLVLASPVYFGRMSGSMACLVDRTRCFMFAQGRHLALKGKIGVALAVGWGRNFGIETTLQSLHAAFLMHEMRTPSCHAAGALFGVAAVSGPREGDPALPSDRRDVERDREALRAARLLVQEALRTAREHLPTNP